MNENQSTMSKKAAIAGMAITALGNQDNVYVIAAITIIAVALGGAQAFLDWKAASK